MNNELKKMNNESPDQYFYRICKMKDDLGFTWTEMANVFNEELKNDCGESKYRKDWAAFERILNANMDRIIGNDAYLDEIKLETRNLEKERKKLQTEKLEYNKWLREEARDELIVEKIIDAIRNSEPIYIPTKRIFPQERGKSAILCFGDEHFGPEFKIYGLNGEVINEYSPEIFYDRMWKLLDEVINIIDKESINELNVFSLGDFTDGILRVKQLMKLRYGVIEGSVQYAMFISEWLNELSNYVRIKYQMTFGNHSELRQLGQPKGTFKDDNTGLFVREIIKIRLESNPNFSMTVNPTGMIFDNIQGFNILGIHGEVKNLSSAMKDFSQQYNTPIDILVGGHMHHFATENVGINKDVISVPSIIGVDEFSMDIKKTANPGATLFFIEENKGKTLEYNIKL